MSQPKSPTSIEECHSIIRELASKVEEQQRFIDRVTSAARHIGLVVENLGKDPKSKADRWKIVVNDSQAAVCLTDKPLKVGFMVLLIPTMGGSLVIDEVISKEPDARIGVVNRIASVTSDSAIILAGGQVTKLRCLVEGLEPGDEALCFASYAIGLHRKKPVPRETFKHTKWDEIGGLIEAKRQLRAIVRQLMEPSCAIAEAYSASPPKGVLLSGPPGNGKTMLARAIATELTSNKAVAAETAFTLVAGPEILDPYVGAAEQKIRNLFDRARKHHEVHGFPAVLVIDEAEAILPTRGSRRSSDVDTTIVPQFLTEMDGFRTGSPITVLLTNRPDTIDPAILRDGRIDVHLNIPNPDGDEARRIAKACFKGLPCKDEVSDLADSLLEALRSARRVISGASIAATVRAAAVVAMHRDRDASKKHATGLIVEDVTEAANRKRSTVEVET